MMKLDIKEKYRRFREWQETPFSYTMNEEMHRCNNCEYECTGNFCPRCGQKAISWRTWKKRTKATGATA
ncbi:MAG: hypothetical protein IJ244_03045 [Bacteroidaceae bacterium]|nr:hypothetical protein [Bacteroidaceae bacterium]